MEVLLNPGRWTVRANGVNSTSVGVGDVCRLTVYGPDSRVELAVPVHVPVADLLPTLLGHLDPRLATSGLEHGGWVLQRLGEPPLEEDLGTAALGLCDGDTVYLRPRDAQLPPIDFDDLVDGVAGVIADRKDRWRPEHGLRLANACTLIMGLIGWYLIVGLPSGVLAAWVAGTCAVVLLAAGTAAVRSFDDRRSAIVLSLLAIGYAALAGLAVPVLDNPITYGRVTAAPSILTAAVFVAAASLLARFGTGTHPAGHAATTGGGALVAVAALLSSRTGVAAAGAAAVLVPVVLLLGYFTPTIAAIAAGLSVPRLPTTPDEFQADLEPESSVTLLRRAAAADRYVTAGYVGLAVVLSGALWLVALRSGIAAPLLVLVVAVLLLLHCRELISAWQRVAMMTPAIVGVGVLLVATAERSSPATQMATTGGLTFLALLACAAGHMLSRRRLIPHWGLAGDIAHWLTAIAVVPLALQICDVYAVAHRWWS